ncbi:MAG: FMN-dependent NADH-azoreductase [Chitinophagaceae bacterium]|nr:FMN-dependent NADH-azoreductase [Chitinophagaceae bacterium]
MKKILNVISSTRGAASYSIQLAEALIDSLRVAYPGSTVKTVNLAEKHFPHLEESHIAGFFTPPEQQTSEHKEVLRHSDEAIQDVLEADVLVIGAPMYNFSISSALKAWVDHIVRKGVTFNYSEKGVEGLVKGKKVYVVESSGGVYSDGPRKGMDFVEPYMRTVLGFIGLTDVTMLRVEGTAVPGVKEQAMERALAEMRV